MNKQAFAMGFGLVLVVGHMGFLAYLLSNTYLDPRLSVKEIILPPALTYLAMVGRWFVANQGKVTKDDTIGLPYAAVIVLFVGFFYGVMGVSYGFYYAGRIDAEDLNNAFLFAESCVGLTVGLIMKDLFAVKETLKAA